MRNEHLETFARALVQEVRDRAIRQCDTNLRTEAESVTAKRWRSLGLPLDESGFRTLLSDSVDIALFFLLHAIDQGVLPLQLRTADGQTVDLEEAGMGELAGWYIGPDGWRATFSRERSAPLGGSGPA